MRYRPSDPLVLRNVSLEVRPREKVGVCGRTGSGKSSTTLALFRAVELAGGRITIDGVDIATLGLHDLRSRLTIIPQDPVLFSGTLRYNLDPTGAISTADLWRSLERVRLSDKMRADPAGLDLRVAEGGENFSVGERQLLCMARALLRGTRVVILDEATASIDSESDAIIQRMVREELRECTVITIAHRLHTIIDYDRILVLDAGAVAEFGPPQTLLATEGSHFRRLWEQAQQDAGQHGDASA
jgi:ABC-type multidrug transport system fused ATPase/permease subunit